MATVDVPRKLWEHPDPRSTEMYKLMQEINTKQNIHLEVRDSLPYATHTLSHQALLVDLLGPVPVLHNPTLKILGPGVPIPWDPL
jgi:hypothetical protein